MPMGVYHAHRLTHLGCYEAALLDIDAEHIDFDMQKIIAGEFDVDAPRDDIEIVKSFQYPGDDAWVGVGDYLESGT